MPRRRNLSRRKKRTRRVGKGVHKRRTRSGGKRQNRRRTRGGQGAQEASARVLTREEQYPRQHGDDIYALLEERKKEVARKKSPWSVERMTAMREEKEKEKASA